MNPRRYFFTLAAVTLISLVGNIHAGALQERPASGADQQRPAKKALINAGIVRTLKAGFEESVIIRGETRPALSIAPTQSGTGSITVNATLDGNPWSGQVSYTSDFGETQPVPSVSGTEVPKTFSGQQAGVYHFFYNSGGPAGTVLSAWVPADRQTLSPGGAVTFTMVFRTDIRPPTAPSNLQATAVSTSQINLSWTNNANNETKFKVERKQGGGSFTLIANNVGPNVTSFEDKNLSSGTSYTYRVRAFNSAGESAYSNEAMAMTLAVAAPVISLPNTVRTIPKVTVGQSTDDSGFQVWNKGDAPLQISSIARINGSGEFTIVLPASFPETIPPQTTSFTLTIRFAPTTAGSKSATFRIASNDPATPTVDFTLESFGQALQPPGLPSNPDPRDQAPGVSTTPTLSWSATGATSYEVRFGTTETPSVVSPNQTAVSFTPDPLQFGTTYFWQVVAKNADGSTPGPLWRFTTQGGTGTITVNATLDGNLWSGAASFHSDFGDTLPQPSISGAEVPKTFSGQQAGVYHLFYSSGGPAGAVLSAWVPADRQTLTPGGAVTFTMVFRTDIRPPAAPSNLQATALSASQINLSWTNNANDQTRFEVERRQGAESFSLIANNVGANGALFEDKNLNGATAYTYRVRAFNAVGNSGYSNEASATTLGDPPTISLPNTVRTIETTLVGQMTEVTDFAVMNKGDAPLLISSITRVSGSSEFSVPSPATFPVTIAARSFINLTLRFAPTSTGSKSATFRISSNDPVKPTVDFLLEGVTSAPHIGRVTPSSPTRSDSIQRLKVDGSVFQSELTVTMFKPDGNTETITERQIEGLTATSFTMLVTLNVAGSYGIRVNNPDSGQSNIFNFTVVNPISAPQIDSISPPNPTRRDVDQRIVVKGNGFQPELTVTVFLPGGGTTTKFGAQIEAVTNTSFTLLVTLNVAGLYGFRVNNPDSGQSNIFNFTVANPISTPQIDSIAPRSPTMSGTVQNVEVTGSGFERDLTVTLFSPDGGTETLSGTQIQNVGSGSFTLVVTLNQTGNTGIRVNNPDGGRSNIFGFTTVAANPVINSILPASPTATVGNQNVTVNGNNFQANLTVTVFLPNNGGSSTLSGAQILNVTANSFVMVIDFNGNPGTYSIRVNNPNGAQSNTFTFTVANPIVPADGAMFVGETIGNGTQMTPGESFTKTWTIRNSGTTTWNSGYKLRWVSGASMSNHQDVAVVGTVSPGNTYTFSVAMTAPASSGTYREDWRFLSPNGTTINVDSSSTIWVSINVIGPADPKVLSVVPSQPTVSNSNQPLTVNGTGFLSGLSVRVTAPSGSVTTLTGPAQIQNMTPTSFTIAIVLHAPRTWTIQVTNPDNRESDAFRFVVTEKAAAPVPVASFTFSPQAPNTGQPVQFADASTGASPLTWAWDFDGDGVTDSTVQNPTHTFTTPGPYQVTLKISNAYGENKVIKTVTIGSTAGVPAITNVLRQYPGIFLQGTNLDNRFDIKADWHGSPGKISFSINGGPAIFEGGTAVGASHILRLGSEFAPKFSNSTVTITPSNAEGVVGTSWQEPVYVFPYPEWLKIAIEHDPSRFAIDVGDGEIKARIRADFPDPHLAKDGPLEIPSWVPYVGGKFGLTETFARIQGSVSSAGTGNLTLSGQTGFTAAGNTINGDISGSGQFRLGPPGGLELTGASFKLDIDDTLTKQIGIIDAIPQLKTFKSFPPIRFINEQAILAGEIGVSLNFASSFAQKSGMLQFNEATGTLGIQLGTRLVVKPGTDLISATGSVSGGGTITIGVPEPFLRKATLTLQAAAEFSMKHLFRIGDFSIGPEISKNFALNAACTWVPNSWDCNCNFPLLCTPGSIPPESTVTNVPISLPVSIILPDYARYGPYSAFHPTERMVAMSPNVPASVRETALVSNIFAGAAPALIQVAAGKLLLWEHQDTTLPVPQSTDITWAFNDGNGWTSPSLIGHDSQAELSPVAGVDSNGNVVAAWLRIKDPAFSTPINTDTDLPLFYTRLEVMSSVFDPNTRTWGPISQLTDDTASDTDLRLSSDRAGHLLLTWLSNSSGELFSTSSDPSTLKYSFWNGSSWSAPSVVASGLAGVSTHATAVQGSNAFVILPRDPDIAVGNDGVLDLYKWNGTSWSVPTTFVAGGVENRLPSAVYDGSGEGHVVWLRGNDLVHATLSDPTPRIVRTGSGSLAFYDTRLLTNSQGNLTLVWQQAVDNGPANIFAVLYDPVSETWSADRRLNEDASLAHDVSGYYGSDGQMHLAYLATDILRTTETVELGGVTHTIPNIPQDGATELRLLDHSLIVDLAVTDKDLTITPQSPQPGDSVIATVDVHNAGDFPVGSFLVNVYVGAPEQGGVLVGSSSMTGPFVAGDHRVLTFSFTYPAGGGEVVAVVDAGNAIAEFSETNNRATTFLTNGAPEARVVATVTNGAAPLTVNFDASTSSNKEGEALAFSWAFGDGSSSASGQKVTHTFTQAGSYPVTVAVTDTHGAVGTAVVMITVVTAPPSITSLSPSSVRAGSGAISLTVVGSNFVSGSSVLWSGSPRATAFVDSTRLVATIPGSDLAREGTAQVSVVNPGPEGGTSNALTFTINPPNRAPTANAGPAISVDELSSVAFTGATASDPDPGDPLSISWNIVGGDVNGTLANPNTLTPTYTAPDLIEESSRTVTAVMTVIDGSGATASSNKTITVNRTLSVTGVTFKGGTLTITGTGFASGAIVKVDGVAIAGFVNVSSSTTITVSGSRKQLGIKPKGSLRTFQVLRGANNSNVFSASP